MPINVSSTFLTTPRRGFNQDTMVLPQRLAPQSPIDSFTPVLAPQANVLVQQPQAGNIVPSQSSGGGFFSNLWGSIKGLASNLLGSVGNWFSSNVGGWMSSAKTAASGIIEGLFSKASNWFGGLLSGWINKLRS